MSSTQSCRSIGLHDVVMDLKMLVDVCGLPVVYPYPTVSKQQLQIMEHVHNVLRTGIEGKRALSLLEAKTGSGKTLAVLSTAISFWDAYPTAISRIVFLCRTIPVVDHVLNEIFHLNKARGDLSKSTTGAYISNTTEPPLKQEASNLSLKIPVLRKLRALPITSRRRLCINESVSRTAYLDTECIRLTRGADLEDTAVCPAFKNILKEENELSINRESYTIPDFIDHCKRYSNGEVCPYFANRRLLHTADIIVGSYNYILDPKCAGPLGAILDRNTLLIIDEAHNLEYAACDAMSMHLSYKLVVDCEKSIRMMSDLIAHSTLPPPPPFSPDRSLIRKERAIKTVQQDSRLLFSGSAPADVLLLSSTSYAAIKTPQQFLSGLLRIVRLLKEQLSDRLTKDVVSLPHMDVLNLMRLQFVGESFLQLSPEYLHYYQSYYRIFDKNLPQLVQFLSLLGYFGSVETLKHFRTYSSSLSYEKFFTVIQKPQTSTGDDDTLLAHTQQIFEHNKHQTLYRLVCQDPFIALRPVYQYFPLIIMMSATLFASYECADTLVSPSGAVEVAKPSMIERILGITMYAEQCERSVEPVIKKCIVESGAQPNTCIKIIGKGADQAKLTTQFFFRTTPSAVQNYGRILAQISSSTSDGLIVFFPSYRFMEDLITLWNITSSNMFRTITSNKLVFFETPDPIETMHAVACYRKCCDSGRGAILFAIARGKLSEGIDFKYHHARGIILIGVPYLYSGSTLIHMKLNYLNAKFGIKPSEYIHFDAGRVLTQCIGRVTRKDNDYAAVILADERFKECIKWTTKWMQEMVRGKNSQITTQDEAIRTIRAFFIQQARDTNRRINADFFNDTEKAVAQ